MRHNPEKKEFKGRSYKKKGKRIREMKDRLLKEDEADESTVNKPKKGSTP